jgi:hypothetical protein
MMIALELAGFDDAHNTPEVNIHETESPFTGVQVYEILFAPTLIQFTIHWYAGETPPLTGMAVKVTGVPSSTGFPEASMETLTGSTGFTVMVTVLEVAGLPEIQVALEVSTQVITSLLAAA